MDLIAPFWILEARTWRGESDSATQQSHRCETARNSQNYYPNYGASFAIRGLYWKQKREIGEHTGNIGQRLTGGTDTAIRLEPLARSNRARSLPGWNSADPRTKQKHSDFRQEDGGQSSRRRRGKANRERWNRWTEIESSALGRRL